MIAAIVNAVTVLVGSIFGLVFRNNISEHFSTAIVKGLALCVGLIGVSGALGTQDTMCVILCIVVGTILGEWLRIEQRLDGLGGLLQKKVMGNRTGSDPASARFTEGFMSATLLFCVGSMAIVGSMEAGINHDYTTIFSKSVLDGISSITFAAAMGIGVCFSALGVLLYQGALTLLFTQIGPFLPQAVIGEMSAVGGLLIVGIAYNMLAGESNHKIPVGNMLPAVFLPAAYLPLAQALGALLG